MNFSELLLRFYLIATSDDAATTTATTTTSRVDADETPFTIYVEGNVGCGKSTFLGLFEGDQRIQIVQEPVAEWQNVSGTGIDMLDLMFADGDRWSGSFQHLSTLTRLKAALDIEPGRRVRILERSLYSERFCFVENQRRMSKLPEVDYLISKGWFQLIARHFRAQIKPDLIVYLRADLQTLKDRIKKRARTEESHIDPAFLEGLQECHESWLYYKNSSYPVPAPVLVLDSNLEMDSFVSYVQKRRFEILPQRLFN